MVTFLSYLQQILLVLLRKGVGEGGNHCLVNHQKHLRLEFGGDSNLVAHWKEVAEDHNLLYIQKS